MAEPAGPASVELAARVRCKMDLDGVSMEKVAELIDTNKNRIYRFLPESQDHEPASGPYAIGRLQLDDAYKLVGWLGTSLGSLDARPRAMTWADVEKCIGELPELDAEGADAVRQIARAAYSAWVAIERGGA